VVSAITKVLILYFLYLLQESFFVHFNLFLVFPNLVLVFYLFIIFYASKKHPFAEIIGYGLFSGFLLDVSGEKYFSISIVLLIFLGFLIRIFKNALNEAEGQKSLIYFLVLVVLFSGAYEGVINYKIFLSLAVLAKIAYNIIFGVVVFYIYRYVQKIQGKKSFC